MRLPLEARFAFKGGTAINHSYFGDDRFSEDLDFTILEQNPLRDRP
ncbi:MAG: nucleotidyl transferase AbiEii/AbiGii toxin family protein [Candidatus Wallbacteria bacterium]|nr:nucleotidyl transferase AbiEii/AbiGii toxin family protein [Candidatus Wallbacteria bacterium]